MKRILFILSVILMIFVAGCGEEPIEVEIPEYMVSYYSDGVLYSEETLEVGDMVMPPINPELNGQDFVGWYVDQSYIHPYGFGAMPKQDLNLYAKYDEVMDDNLGTITVTFYSQGGTPVTSETISVGNQYIPTEVPTKVGHKFAGWYMDPGCFYQMPFINDFEDDLALYAKWEISSLTMKFYVDDEMVYEKDYLYGEIVYDEFIPDIPDKVGHSISGWSEEIPDRLYTNIDFIAEYDPNSYLLAYSYSLPNQIVQIIQSISYRVAISESGTIWGWWGISVPELLDYYLDYDEGETVLKGYGEGNFVVLISNMGRISLLNPHGIEFLGRTNVGEQFIHDITEDYTLNVDETIIDAKLTYDNLYVFTSEGRVLVQGYGGTTAGLGISGPLVGVAEMDFSSLLDVDESIVGIETGPRNGAVYTDSNSIFAWGTDGSGIVGDGPDNSIKSLPVEAIWTSGPNEEIIKLDIGYSHASLLTTEDIYMVGGSFYLETGSIQSGLDVYTAMGVAYSAQHSIDGVVDVFAGEGFTIVQTDDGSYHGIGKNDYGQLSDGTFIDKTSFVEIFSGMPIREGETIERLFVGEGGGYAITSFGFFYGWGSNSAGQLIYSNVNYSEDGMQLDGAFPELFVDLDIFYADYGSTIALPTPPPKEGYVFVGWYNITEIQGSELILILETTMPDNHYALYAYYRYVD